MVVPDPAQIIVAPLGGMDVKASRWAHAAWQNMADQLDDPSRFRVIQPSFNTGVDASAGTHDFDAVMDWFIVGMTFEDANAHGRRSGLATWTRTPAQGFSLHNHGFPIPPDGAFLDRDGKAWFRLGGGLATRVGILIPQQLIDYHNDALGLAASVGGHTPGSDHQPHPDPQFVFNYEEYIVSEQNILDAIHAEGQKTREVVNARAAGDVKRDKAILDAIDALPTGATKGDVRLVVQKALATFNPEPTV